MCTQYSYCGSGLSPVAYVRHRHDFFSINKILNNFEERKKTSSHFKQTTLRILLASSHLL